MKGHIDVENETVYSAQEIADILKIKKNTVYNMIKRGDLPAYKIGNKMRISSLEVEKYKRRSLSGQSGEISITQDRNLSNDYFTSPIIDEPVQRDVGFIICGQDAALDTLARHLQNQPDGASVLRSYVGSYNGLYMLYQGQVSIATAHLWDGRTNVYNIPYVEHMLPGVPAVLIHMFNRMQGFYVPKGNPKKVLSWDDIGRNDLVIANREKGSGTRVLLDEHLRISGINPSNLPGYYKECFSHLAVAGAVARGSADFGIGTLSSTKVVHGLEFIPLQKESYDLIIKKEDLPKRLFYAVLDIVRSSDFRMELEEMEEYDITDIGKIVAET
jgi:putative molybdopterin biosynthesis protein